MNPNTLAALNTTAGLVGTFALLLYVTAESRARVTVSIRTLVVVACLATLTLRVIVLFNL